MSLTSLLSAFCGPLTDKARINRLPLCLRKLNCTGSRRRKERRDVRGSAYGTSTRKTRSTGMPSGRCKATAATLTLIPSASWRLWSSAEQSSLGSAPASSWTMRTPRLSKKRIKTQTKRSSTKTRLRHRCLPKAQTPSTGTSHLSSLENKRSKKKTLTSLTRGRGRKKRPSSGLISSSRA